MRDGRVNRRSPGHRSQFWASVSASTRLQSGRVTPRRKPAAATVPPGGVDTVALDGDPAPLRLASNPKLADWVRAQVASAPPLSLEQSHRLSRLFEAETPDRPRCAKPQRRVA
jgi:hypothetical protein